MKWRSRWRKVISRVTLPKVYSTASPWSSVRTTRRYSRNSLSGIGCCPVTRIAPVTAHSIATLLDVTNQVPFIDMSVEADAEFHRYVLLMRRARAAGSKTVSTVGVQAAALFRCFCFYPVWFDVNSSLPEGFHIAGSLRIFRFLITPTAPLLP